jgi:hypothetical protein
MSRATDAVRALRAATRSRARDDEVTAVTKLYAQTGDALDEAQEHIRRTAALAERLRRLLQGDDDG